MLVAASVKRTLLQPKGWLFGGAVAAGLTAAAWRSAGVKVTPFRQFRASPLSTIFSASLNPAMANLTPPQPPPQWTHSAEDILRLTKEAIEVNRAEQDKVAALKEADCNFDSVRVVLSRGSARS